MYKYICIVVFLAILVGCGQGMQNNLPFQYAKSARKVGIFPVYPPREEFQIGDVYMWSQSNKNINDTETVYLTTIDWLRHDADIFMKSRIVFSNTTVDAGKVATNSDIPPTRGSTTNLATRGDLRESDLAKSLPIAAFPAVSADAGFTGAFGLTKALIAIGIAGGSRTTVTLNFNDVRTYYVPKVSVRDKIHLDELPKILPTYTELGRIELNRLIALKRGRNVKACSAGRVCGVSVVTRVYLTRQINYTYRNAKIISAGLKRTSQAPVGGKSSGPSLSGVVVSVGSDQNNDSAALAQQVATLQTDVNKMLSDSTSGESVQFQAWDATGLTYANKFQRPVVIGWDGPEYSFNNQ